MLLVTNKIFPRAKIASRKLIWAVQGSLCMAVLAAGSALASTVLRPNPKAAQLNNLGTARMNQQRFDDAEINFAAAFHADSKNFTMEINQGIALLYLNKRTEAAAALQDAAMHDSKNVRAWYCLGLLQLRSGKTLDAVQDFQRAVALRPLDADPHYMLGRAQSQLGNYSDAIAEFLTALHLNVNDASAEYGLASAFQHSGNHTEAQKHFQRFHQLTSGNISAPFTDVYGESGHFAVVQTIQSTAGTVAAMIPVAFVRQAENPLQPATFLQPAAGSGAMCIIDLEHPGEMDLVTLGSGTSALQFYRNDGHGKFTAMDVGLMGLAASGTAVACAVGDFNHDGLDDLAVAFSDRVILFKNLGHGKFADVTQLAGITPRNLASALTFVDYDHDGDLDLLVTGRANVPGASPNVLWRNNGNGTFTDWTAQTGLGGTTLTSGVELSDINNDRAVDLITTGAASAPTIYLNPREGIFPSQPLFANAGLPPTRGIYVFDFDKDGWMDVVVTHAGAPGVTLWRNIHGKRFERVPLPIHDAIGGWGVTAIDIDNDGWLDLAVVIDTAHGPQLRVIRNLGARGFADVTKAVQLESLQLHSPRTLIAADVDHDGAADLLVGQGQGSPLVLHNVGGNKNHSLRIQLRGEADNQSGIGTKVEIYSGTLWQKWEVAGATGYQGQGPAEILAGIGTSNQADVVRLLWPTGVPQDEINVAADKPVTLVELDRRGSSCPTLFSWDGSKYQFVSDVIGAAVVGHWVSPTQRNLPDPDEWIKIDGSQLRSYQGRFSLRFGEPMEEVNYMDQVRLIAVDHPIGTDVNADEKFLSEPPFASGKILLSSFAHPLAGAWDDQGHDVRALLLTTDHRYVGGFTPLRFDGFANQHQLTLDLGAWSPKAPLYLLLHGYVNYFSANSMYAAWQAGLRPIPPYVEAQLPNGSWQRVIDDMGFPAGLPRTIVVNLTDKLPLGTRRIRIVTNLQIYWDQILVDNEAGSSHQMHTTEVPLDTAQLAFRGYPEQIEGNSPGDLTYNYNHISQTGPFVRLRGQYTRYGDVTPLLRRVDDRFVIFGSGEDMDLEFRADILPQLPLGWKRDYFFYANGYVKDMDFYEASPFTVSELPFHTMHNYPYPDTEQSSPHLQHMKYQIDCNSRFESGHPQPYAFHYLPRQMRPPTVLPAEKVAIPERVLQP